MSSSSDSCIESPDLYGIISCVPYLIFGFIGLVVNNSFLSDTHAFLIMLGLGGMLDYSGVLPDLLHICLTLCVGTLSIKLTSEMIKQTIRNHFDENEKLGPFTFDRLHRHPSSLVTLIKIVHICITIYYQNVYSNISLIMMNQLALIWMVLRFFKRGTINYKKTRYMLLKSTFATILGCIGYGTVKICFDAKWSWARLFIGAPIGNFCLAYAIFIAAQLTLLLRGKNIHRRVEIRGSQYVFIAYYTGRLTISADEQSAED